MPPEAYTAKTIAIVNHTNTQRVTDCAYQELQKWGRFTVEIREIREIRGQEAVKK